MPLGPQRRLPSADEVILPYCGKTVWLWKKRIDVNRFFFEIKDSGGLIIAPDWVDCFDSDDLVPPAEYVLQLYGIENDLWLDEYKDRLIIIDDLLIVTG